jgi:hypothetical protein
VSRFVKKDWVCLVTPLELEAERQLQAARNEGSWMAGRPLQKPLWRQIDISATLELVTIHLGSVDEEVARGGVWSGSYAARTVKLTWDDLNDLDSMAQLFHHEQVCVMQKAAEMFAVLREHMVPLRLALAA